MNESFPDEKLVLKQTDLIEGKGGGKKAFWSNQSVEKEERLLLKKSCRSEMQTKYSLVKSMALFVNICKYLH